MKGKISIMIIFSLLCIFSSCYLSQIKKNEITVQINPNLEFINSILLTSKYNEITKPFIGYGLMTEHVNHYTNSIKEYFEPYKESEIYSFIENMIPSGFTFSRPVELMLSLGISKDFSMQFPLSDLCIQYCGGMENITFLLNQLNEFSKETNYFEYFGTIKSYYDQYVQKTNDFFQSIPFIYMVEDIYGKKMNSYNIILSDLMIGNYGIHFLNKEDMSADIFIVLEPYSALSANIIIHELSHPFINPLTEKYWYIA
jgi:hypothetical protein